MTKKDVSGAAELTNEQLVVAVLGPDGEHQGDFARIHRAELLRRLKHPRADQELREFVEQAQFICEKPTGPEGHDIDKLRRLGKKAFPFGAKDIGDSYAQGPGSDRPNFVFQDKTDNCFQACVASIFALPLESVPHFQQGVMASADHKWTQERWDAVVEFAESYGRKAFWLDPDIATDRPFIAKLHDSGLHYIATGKSPLGNYGHCVIWHQGKMVHDPLRSGSGIEGEPWLYIAFEAAGADARGVLEKAWLVWSHEHGLWWRANNRGYTSSIDEAGRYTLTDALSCCDIRSRRPDGTPNEIVQPSPEWIKKALAESALSQPQSRKE